MRKLIMNEVGKLIHVHLLRANHARRRSKHQSDKYTNQMIWARERTR